jgi:formamidopyrimidine-DNA glycosylase
LQSRLLGQTLEHATLKNPFLLRTADPPLQSCEGHRVVALERVGKRIAIGFDNDHWLLLHLMIAGRLHWYAKTHKGKVRAPLLALQFTSGTLTLTEAGTKRRASLHVLSSAKQLPDHDRGGMEVLGADSQAFRERLSRTNHTLKRALTDPTILSGVGNAYSDEILHRARLSPTLQTRHLSDAEWQQLYDATQATLADWIERLRADAAGEFPEKVTAFRNDMAVHGRYGKPCPVCGTAIQRIRYAENETNYCPRCQTGGKLLADRSLSRLLKDDWPKTIEALENQRK